MSIQRWIAASTLVTALVFAPAAQATTPSPSEVSGNPKCPSGTTSVKFESPSVGTQTLSGVALTLSNKKTVSGFDLPGTGPFNAVVIVKGGPGANIYTFTGVNVVTGVALVSPPNRGGNVPDISHVQFCLKPGEQPPGDNPPPPCGDETNPCPPLPCPEGTHPSPDGKVCIQPAPPVTNTVTVVVNPTTNTVVNINNTTTNKKTVVNKCKCKAKSRRCPAKKKAKKKCPPLKYIKFRLDGPSIVGPARTARAHYRVRGATSYIEKVVYSVNGVKKHTDWRGPSFTYTTIAKHLRGKEYVFGRKRVTAKLYLVCNGRRLVVKISKNIDP